MRQMGYTVCVTSNNRHTANTKGTPDVFCRVKGKTWLALEFKAPTGKLSEEQEEIKDGVYICRSVQDAIDVVVLSEEAEEV